MRKLPEIFLARKQIGTFRENISPTLNKNLYILTKDLDLTTRTLNIFTSENIKYVGDLVQYSEKSLSKLPNMGVKSIDEINRVISDLSLYLGMNIVNWPPDELKELQNQREGLHVAKIPLDFSQLNFLTKNLRDINLPTRACNALLNLGYNTMSDLLLYANAKELKRTPNFGNTSMESIEQLLASHNIKFEDSLEPWSDEIQKEVREVIDEQLKIKRSEIKTEDKFLEDELIRILNEGIYASKKRYAAKDRVINVLVNRYGLDGSPGKTLEIIGKKYNVTRERIRQNQQFGLIQLRKSRPLTPILNKVFNLLLETLPILEIDFNQILKNRNITKQDWDFDALKSFYESFTNRLDFYVSKGNGLKIITNNLKNNFNNLVSKVVNKKISSNGIFSISECINLNQIYSNNVRKETIKKILQTKNLFHWLDEDQNIFTYYSQRNRLLNLISKAATASNQINIDNLYQKIINHHRMKNIHLLLTKKIFIKFCEISFDCEVTNNDTILFHSTQSKLSNYAGHQGNIIAPNEQKILDIFTKYGPILGWTELKEFAKKFNVSEASLNMMMQFSPLFQRIDKATYVLSGNKLNENFKKAKIDLMSNSYKLNECDYVENGSQYYIEVFKLEKYIKTLAYPRTLMEINEVSKGILYKNKVYPIVFL